ncbi:MAG: hypothetical protein LBM93_11040, partial [Oscillospiraceae bacterium]|jgi:hypothetical protein|nr:hypothetical protein [Oscillospiraceae bacterium]
MQLIEEENSVDRFVTPTAVSFGALDTKIRFNGNKQLLLTELFQEAEENGFEVRIGNSNIKK